jgi:hypothetical protein
MNGCTAAFIRMWSCALIWSALTKAGASIARRVPSASVQIRRVIAGRIERHDLDVVVEAVDMPERAVGVVLDQKLLHRVVRHALAALVEPAECGLDAVRCVIREGKRNRAGRRDREQVAVADAVRSNRGLDRFGQP